LSPPLRQNNVKRNQTMKKSLIALCAICALSLAAYAGDDDKKPEAGKKREASAEQKALHKEMLEKYDTNKDGKLDESERAKMSDADKAKVKEARSKAAEHSKSEDHKKEEKAK
jgi:hypothetical protein